MDQEVLMLGEGSVCSISNELEARSSFPESISGSCGFLRIDDTVFVDDLLYLQHIFGVVHAGGLFPPQTNIVQLLCEGVAPILYHESMNRTIRHAEKWHLHPPGIGFCRRVSACCVNTSNNRNDRKR